MYSLNKQDKLISIICISCPGVEAAVGILMYSKQPVFGPSNVTGHECDTRCLMCFLQHHHLAYSIVTIEVFT